MMTRYYRYDVPEMVQKVPNFRNPNAEKYDVVVCYS